MSNSEIECALRACRLLQSNSSDSAELLRLYLDEAIKQKYGSHKTLTNVLKKEILEEEQRVCGLITSDSDITSHDDSMVEGLKNLLQDDLTCIICRGMDVTAGNRLVECSDCHALYHQECHRPHIPENEVNDPDVCWSCSECKAETDPIPKSYKDKSKETSKSPASNSGYTKLYSGSSSKSSSKSDSSSKSSSPTVSSSKITPHIRILTHDKHVQNLKRKASKQGDSKKKH